MAAHGLGDADTAFAIRRATPDDSETIHTFIRELAEYEQILHQAVLTSEDVRSSLFGDRPQAEVLLAELEAVPVGFALYFHNYSTLLGRHGLYLEDLYVRPQYRGRGFGRKLLSALAALAAERGCGRLEWAVLNWNESAIAFYRSLGARPMSDWTVYRLSGADLERVAADASAVVSFQPSRRID